MCYYIFFSIWNENIVNHGTKTRIYRARKAKKNYKKLIFLLDFYHYISYIIYPLTTTY
jgi:hypothetical protein